MAVNKVEVGGETVIDLTADTVSENNLLAGATAHNAAGEQIVGTMSLEGNGSSGGGGLTIENAVVIKQDDSAYILHNFTEIDYIAGNKIGYTGAKSPIILQGLTVYAQGSTAPNGLTVKDTSASDPSLLPNIPTYMGANFSPHGLEYWSSDYREVTGLTCYMTEAYPTYSMYRYAWKYLSQSTGNSGTWGITQSSYDSNVGVALAWTTIYAPGTTRKVNTKSITYEYGYALCYLYYKYKTSTTYYLRYLTDKIAVPFASEAEYNAAVGLTYEPNTLKLVVDTEEVTG